MEKELNFRSQEEPFVQDPPTRHPGSLAYVLRECETLNRDIRTLLKHSESPGVTDACNLSFVNDITLTEEDPDRTEDLEFSDNQSTVLPEKTIEQRNVQEAVEAQAEPSSSGASMEGKWIPTLDYLKMLKSKRTQQQQKTSASHTSEAHISAMVKLLPRMRLQKGKESALQALKRKIVGEKSQELDEAWELLEKKLTKSQKVREVSDAANEIPGDIQDQSAALEALSEASESDISSYSSYDSQKTVIFVPLKETPSPTNKDASDDDDFPPFESSP